MHTGALLVDSDIVLGVEVLSKKIIKIALTVLIILVIVFLALFKLDSAKRAEEHICEAAEQLLTSVYNKDFDKIKAIVKNTNGEDLSQQEIYNFLLNSDLYRLTFYDNNNFSFTSDAKVGFLDTSEGVVELSFSALDGDLIINTLQYVNTGVNEYFVTDDIKESDKEVKKYPFAKNLANGEEFSYENEDSEKEYLFTYRYGKDENDDFYIEVIEEAKEDLKIAVFNSLEDTLKDKDNECRYEWNEDCSAFSVYYSSEELRSTEDLELLTTAIFSSTAIQAVNETYDWKLSVSYYDYNTNELLNTKIIR